jgi:hypothetical protein
MSSDILDVFRGQIPSVPGIELATIIQATPLVIRLDNDKMMLSAKDGDLMICEHVIEHQRQYSTVSDMADSDVSYWEETTDHELRHKHDHEVEQLTIDHQIVTIHYKLKAGDRVVVMALPGGQQYLIWDKVVILS